MSQRGRAETLPQRRRRSDGRRRGRSCGRGWRLRLEGLGSLLLIRRPSRTFLRTPRLGLRRSRDTILLTGADAALAAHGNRAARALQALHHQRGPLGLTGNAAERQLQAVEKRIVAATVDDARALRGAQHQGATLGAHATAMIAQIELGQPQRARLHANAHGLERALGSRQVDAGAPGPGVEVPAGEPHPAVCALGPGIGHHRSHQPGEGKDRQGDDEHHTELRGMPAGSGRCLGYLPP